METVAPATFGCPKWADCGCSTGGRQCGCGETCSCGVVPVADVVKAMEEECAYSDCACGLYCTCGKGSCGCGGSTEKTREQWVDFVKHKDEAGCRCTKAQTGTCTCGPNCSCRGDH